MARTKYGRYLLEKNHCYVISNANNDYAEDVTGESYSEPAIKMSIMDFDGCDSDTIFSAGDEDQCPPQFIKNLHYVVYDKSLGWKLTGVNVSANGVYLIYAYNSPENPDDDSLWDSGLVCVSNCCNPKLRFEIKHNNDSPLETYEVEIIHSPRQMVIITEYVEASKRRVIEMRVDNHDKSVPNGQQYCVITEY